jgi:hypothetical protein
MSSWLSKRLAMESKSEKAMEYKNFFSHIRWEERRWTTYGI